MRHNYLFLPVLMASFAQEGWGESKTQTKSFEQVLIDVYLTNPDLEDARTNLRLTDEDAAKVLSEWRPSLSVEGSHTGSVTRQERPPAVPGTQDRTSKSTRGDIVLRQNLFAGGGTAARMRQTDSAIQGARAQLYSAEQQAFLNAISAFVNFKTKEKEVALNKNSLAILKQVFEQATARYEVGEVSLTDVASAEAQVAGAEAKLITAEAELKTSRAAFFKVAGYMPENLGEAKILAQIPKTEEEFLALASKNNPDLQTAFHSKDVSKHAIDAQTAQLLPSLNVQASTGRSISASSPRSFGSDGIANSSSITFSLSVPLYNASTQSDVRKSHQSYTKAKIGVEKGKRDLKQAAKKAWSEYLAALKAKEQYALQVKAATLALEGAREEYTAGVRTLLEVSDQENKLLQAQVGQVQAEGNVIIGTYQILALAGGLTASNLKLSVASYDVKAHYEEVTGSIYNLEAHDPSYSYEKDVKASRR